MARSANKVYVGYDSREDIAWQVCRHSIERHASTSIDVFPLKQAAVRELGLYTRPYDKMSSTEFSLTRFLVPYIAAHDGWTMFMDCDILLTADLNEVFDGLDDSKALYVVQHEYTPANMVKMDGKAQTIYPRKNWSSVMLFNGANKHVKALTPGIVNAAEPSFLHRFEWLPDDSLLGALDLDWNFLEGEYIKPEQTPRAIHFTNGGPWFERWQSVDYADLWRAEESRYLASVPTRVGE